MYFDFEDGHPDIYPVGRAISWREGVLLSIMAHLIALLGLILVPFMPDTEAAVRARELALQQQRQREDSQRFVFVQPRLDIPAPQPRPDVDASDQDRVARTPLQMPNAQNPLPYARGNTTERVEAPPTSADRSKDRRAEEAEANGNRGADMATAAPERPAVPESSTGALRMPNTEGRSAEPGGLGRALRNLQRYIDQESFDNQQGGAAGMGPLQFDTKGVEFGPWVRRFVAQIKRNWFIPYAAMSLRGHVVLTFYVHKDGTLTDIQVRDPSPIEAFNNAAYNALAASNPTQPLPPEYPSDKAFFTVTFYYNETPR
ncbi:MAG: TonB family protein [Acidobacteria bacterium]|nr:TonB family protein [Acidobacteriota bacterium]